jgi:hypothetical protein
MRPTIIALAAAILVTACHNRSAEAYDCAKQADDSWDMQQCLQARYSWTFEDAMHEAVRQSNEHNWPK